MACQPYAGKHAPTRTPSSLHCLWATRSYNIGQCNPSRVRSRLGFGARVTAHSLDTAGLYVYGTGEYIHELKPDEEECRDFQVLANATTEVFGSISGLRDKERQRFWIETTPVEITVGEEVAKLESMFALTEPYTTMGKVVKVEAKVKGLKDSKHLDLVFKAEDSSGESKSLEKIEIKQLDAGQEARFTTEITPSKVGIYTIHAYLHHYWRRIGHRWDTIYVEE